MPPLYVLSCPPKPQPHVPSLYSYFPSPRGPWGCAEPQGSEAKPGVTRDLPAWGQSHGHQGDEMPGWEGDAPGRWCCIAVTLWEPFWGRRHQKRSISMVLVFHVWEGLGIFRVWGVKNSGKAHPHGIKAPLFVVDAHVSWSSPLLLLYGTWCSAKEINSAWTQYQGPRGEEARGGQRNHLGHSQPVGRV